jgi:hypothetical protein
LANEERGDDHTNPKRKRGQLAARSSLMPRVGVEWNTHFISLASPRLT